MAPWQAGPMAAVNDPVVSSICMMMAAQVGGKTTIIENIVGYFIDADPAPILVVQPTIEFAESFSKERLVPLVRDTPCLAGKVADARSRDSGNTILMKSFPGGNIAIVGANAPTGLAGRPRRVVVQDEIDRYPASAGTEGDPCLLADKRAESFWNAVHVKTSTPTTKGSSRIESEFEQSDQNYWFVTCPQCHVEQTLKWANVDFGDKGTTDDPKLICDNVSCRAALEDADRIAMVKGGHWKPTAPFKGKRGFHLNALYALFKAKKGFRNRLHQIVAGFIEAKQLGKEGLKTWINTVLAETFADETQKIDADPLYERREAYPAELPEGTLVLTAGLDVQDDRIEAESVGWGMDEESWGIEKVIFMGSPTGPDVWRDVDAWLDKRWSFAPRADGHVTQLGIACAFIDSGRHTDDVYLFTQPRQHKRVYSVKGNPIPGSPIVDRPRKSSVKRVILFMVGTETAKEKIFSRLCLDAPGPGYMHFPVADGYDPEYFRQLTGEEAYDKIYKGQKVKGFRKTRARNEALDIRVYAMAALVLLNPNFVQLKARMLGAEPAPQRRPVNHGNYQLRPSWGGKGFVGGWKR